MLVISLDSSKASAKLLRTIKGAPKRKEATPTLNTISKNYNTQEEIHNSNSQQTQNNQED